MIPVRPEQNHKDIFIEITVNGSHENIIQSSCKNVGSIQILCDGIFTLNITDMDFMVFVVFGIITFEQKSKNVAMHIIHCSFQLK